MSRMITSTRRTASMALMTLLVICTSTNGFTMTPMQLHPSAAKTAAPLTQTNMLGESAALTLASPILSSTFASTMDPFIEAELFNDAAHIALDLTTFLGPATLAVRLAAVIGRIFCILSDYLPDHSMLPEELVFQVAMLIVATFGFYTSVTPMLQASMDSQDEYKDRKCFASLLRPVGCSWMQYKILKSQGVFEWKSVTANQRLVEEDDENVLHWVYSGQVHQAKDKAAKSGVLLGDLSLLMNKATTNKKDNKTTGADSKKTLVAGSQGATVVRIDTTKLQSLMKKDELLDKAIRNLLLNSMQEKVAALTAS